MDNTVRVVLGDLLTAKVRLAWPDDYSEEDDLLDGGWRTVDLPCFAATLDMSEAFDGVSVSLVYLSRCVFDGKGPETREELFLTLGCIWYAVRDIRFEGDETVFTICTEAVQ